MYADRRSAFLEVYSEEEALQQKFVNWPCSVEVIPWINYSLVPFLKGTGFERFHSWNKDTLSIFIAKIQRRLKNVILKFANMRICLQNNNPKSKPTSSILGDVIYFIFSCDFIDCCSRGWSARFLQGVSYMMGDWCNKEKWLKTLLAVCGPSRLS